MSGARLSRQWLVLSVFPEINVKASGTRRWQKGLQCFKFAAKIDKLTMPHAKWTFTIDKAGAKWGRACSLPGRYPAPQPQRVLIAMQGY